MSQRTFLACGLMALKGKMHFKKKARFTDSIEKIKL